MVSRRPGRARPARPLKSALCAGAIAPRDPLRAPPATTSRARCRLPARTDARRSRTVADVVALDHGSKRGRRLDRLRQARTRSRSSTAAQEPGEVLRHGRGGDFGRGCGARSAPPGARRRPRHANGRSLTSLRPRGDVGAPSRRRRDLACPSHRIARRRTPERLVPIREAGPCPMQGRAARRRRQRGESRRRHAPHLERDLGRRVADAQTIAGWRSPIDHSRYSATVEASSAGSARPTAVRVAVELETTHERAVHGQRDVHGALLRR